MILNIIDDFSDGLNDVLEVIGNVATFIWNIIQEIANTIIMLVETVQSLIDWSINNVNGFFPNEISTLLLFTLSVILIFLIYKVLR